MLSENSEIICDALRDFVPIMQFKKAWKTPMEGFHF